MIEINLATIRARWGYSQTQMGELYDVGRDIIANWESGRVSVPFLAMVYTSIITGYGIEDLEKKAIEPQHIPPAPLLVDHENVSGPLRRIEEKLDAIASELRQMRELQARK